MRKAVIVDCFNHYKYRTKYIRDYLRYIGYDVTMLVSDFDHLTRQRIIPNIEDLHLISVPEYKKNLSLKRIYSHISFARKVVKHICDEKYDLVFCEVPPNILVKKLSRIKMKKGFKLYFDIIDLWPESFPYGDLKILPFQIWRGLRDKWLAYSDGIAVECNYYSDILKKKIPDIKTFLVPLAKREIDKKLIEEWKTNYGFHMKKDEIVLGYLGSMNSLIDIDAIVDLINRLSEKYIVVIKIIGDGEKRGELLKRIEETGAKTLFFGKIFEEEKIMNIFGDCHMGINLYKTGLKIGMTIKSLDYYRLGLPIVNSIPGDTMRMVQLLSIGINYTRDSFDIKEVMKFVDNPIESRQRVWDVYKKNYSESAIHDCLKFLEGEN